MQLVKRSQLRLEIPQQPEPPGKIGGPPRGNVFPPERKPAAQFTQLLSHAAFHHDEIGGVHQQRSDHNRQQDWAGRHDARCPDECQQRTAINAHPGRNQPAGGSPTAPCPENEYRQDRNRPTLRGRRPTATSRGVGARSGYRPGLRVDFDAWGGEFSAQGGADAIPDFGWAEAHQHGSSPYSRQVLPSQDGGSRDSLETVATVSNRYRNGPYRCQDGAVVGGRGRCSGQECGGAQRINVTRHLHGKRPSRASA